MSNILENIVAKKRREVEAGKQLRNIASFEKSGFFARETISMRDGILAKSGNAVIAEFKRRSPSAGIINNWSDVKEVVKAYDVEGAAGISILTDEHFFGGSLDDLMNGRVSARPLLRKDFIIDEWQLFEARAAGADVILLIAACLSAEEVRSLAKKANDLGLEVLLELHTEAELAWVCNEVAMVGVNNRNLGDFSVNFKNAAAIAAELGKDVVKIAESGIRNGKDARELRDHGFDGFLIGTLFMNEKDPGLAFKNFVHSLNQQ